MKKFNKKIVLTISSLYIVYGLVIYFTTSFCNSGWCDLREDGFFGVSLFVLLPLAPVFILSLITYKMRDEVFHAWWAFARWWVPLIIIATLTLSNMSGGGTLGLNESFTAFILIILYTILGLVSLIQIIRSYNS